jgi:hypothetical protein
MATSQVNGSSLTDNGFGSFLEANNRNGVMRANGTSTSNVLSSVKVVRPIVSSFASTVVDNNSADKAISGGTFAHDHVKPISTLVTSELAGLSNTAIRSPGNDGGNIRSINKLETLRTRRFTTAIRANKYNRFTGAFDSGFPVVATDSLASDVAATPSRSVPGKITYLRGSKTPYNDSYKAKTN